MRDNILSFYTAHERELALGSKGSYWIDKCLAQNSF